MNITVSTVTPVYSGEKYLKGLVEELDALRDKWEKEKAPLCLQESIFVIDDAIDNSLAVLNKLQLDYPWLKIICLSRNFGQHAATVAGICHTSTDWVVTLDEDLQHKPLEIDNLFMTQASKQVDIVYAIPKSSVHGGTWRDKSSKLIKRIIARITATPQVKLFNSFRLIRGSIARAAASSSSSQTYLDIAISWFTKSCAGKKIELQDERFINNNESGYDLIQLISHARKLIVSSQVDISSYGILTGIFAIFVATAMGVGVILQKLFFPESIASVGWASTITLSTFFSGVVISLLCVLLEYIDIIVANQLGKPTFFTIDRKSDQISSSWYKNKN